MCSRYRGCYNIHAIALATLCNITRQIVWHFLLQEENSSKIDYRNKICIYCCINFAKLRSNNTAWLIWKVNSADPVDAMLLRPCNKRYHNFTTYTSRLLTRDPLSVAVVTSKVVAFSRVDAAVVVQFTVQIVRHRTALRWNRCGVVTFVKCTKSQVRHFTAKYNYSTIIIK